MLTDEQKQNILDQAYCKIALAAASSRKYLSYIISDYVDKMTHKERVDTICSDPEQWQDIFDFHPLTGEEWPDHVEA